MHNVKYLKVYSVVVFTFFGMYTDEANYFNLFGVPSYVTNFFVVIIMYEYDFWGPILS